MPVRCWVVEASLGTTTLGATIATYWIDAERCLVLREVRQMPAWVVVANQPRKISMERSMTVQKLLWNQEISASLFEMPVAPGMRKPDGTVQTGPNGIVPPAPIGLNGIEGPQHPSQCYEPLYTDEAKLAGMEAAIRVDYVIDEKGIPVEVHAVNQLGLGLEEMAEACVARWRYSPAMNDGKAIRTPSSSVLTFQQRKRTSLWHLERVAFLPDAGVTRPVFRKAPYPPPPVNFSFSTAKVPLKLTIDETGTPRDIQAPGTVDAKLAKSAAEIVSKWRFSPGERDGRPVAVSAEFDLVQGSITRR